MIKLILASILPLYLNMRNKKTKRFWIGAPPWIMIGSVVILLPIFIYWTLDNINRQNEITKRLMIEKGDALIRSVEAGTRTGMMGMMSMIGSLYFQRLLQETAHQHDIEYIIITDSNGNIKYHSDQSSIGKKYGEDLDLLSLIKTGELQYRYVSGPEKTSIFEVYRRFSPREIHRPYNWRFFPRIQPKDRLPPRDPKEADRIIFIGLDMSYFEAARKEDSQHTIIMGVILLLIGFGGISSLFLVQAYRSTRSSLTKIKAFSDNVVENMPIGLVALDTEKQVMSCNQTAEEFLRIISAEITGNPADEVLPDEFIDLINELDQTKSNIEREIEIELKDGLKAPIDVSASILEDDIDSFLGYIILFRDLTEVQTLKKEVERSRRLASIGRLAAGVAHEIRNPLSSIKGFATYFGERYKDSSEDRKTAEIMVHEVERLNRVISQLLEFAKPVNIKKENISLGKIIQHSIKMIERSALDKNIDIQMNVPSGLPEIAVDSDRINQVFLNLYLNSIEAMENGGTLSVTVSHDMELQRLKIEIEDNGKGIDQKDLANVFDPYFTTRQSGTGLGLAIVHRIIESHNGEVRIESEPGKGTSVIIYLPVD